jgi:two-component system sensor histidine kinase/response regulator
MSSEPLSTRRDEPAAPERQSSRLAAATRIRGLEGGRRLPIVALSAYVSEEDRGRCLAAGRDDYVVKAVDSAALGAVLLRLAGPNQGTPA